MATLAPASRAVDSRRRFSANLSAAVVANTRGVPASVDGRTARATVEVYTVSLYRNGRYLKTIEGPKSKETAAAYCETIAGNDNGLTAVATRHDLAVSVPAELAPPQPAEDVRHIGPADLVGSDGLLGGSRHLGPVPAGDYKPFKPKGGPVLPAGSMRIVPASQNGNPLDGTYLTISTADWKRLKGGAV